MKLEQVSEHIWCLQSQMLMLIPVRVWVVVSEGGLTLVDTGIPSMASGITRFIHEFEAGPLQRILLTHGHSDHVGCVNEIAGKLDAPVYAHRIELPYVNGELPYPRRKKAESRVRPGLIQPLEEDAAGTLAKIADLVPYHAPGHSPGHVVYYHEKDRVLLSGDLFTSKKGRLRRPMPMFTGDMAQAIQSSLIVKQLQPRRVEICHGDSVFNPAAQIDDYIRSNGMQV